MQPQKGYFCNFMTLRNIEEAIYAAGASIRCEIDAA